MLWRVRLITLWTQGLPTQIEPGDLFAVKNKQGELLRNKDNSIYLDTCHRVTQNGERIVVRKKTGLPMYKDKENEWVWETKLRSASFNASNCVRIFIHKIHRPEGGTDEKTHLEI